jgi:hypothetical protein
MRDALVSLLLDVEAGKIKESFLKEAIRLLLETPDLTGLIENIADHEDTLTDLVLEIKHDEASEINDEVESQVAFLVQHGWSIKEINGRCL